LFNLLVQWSPWDPSHGSVSVDRVFEHTDPHVTSQFSIGAVGKQPDLEKLAKLPCIFMLEGKEDQIAHVGRIISLRANGRELALEYAFDPDIPPLTNRFIHEHRSSFRMNEDFEFYRSHWAVKDVDLFRLLLRYAHSGRQHPSVFNLPKRENITANLVSAMMPFGSGFDPVYAAIKGAAEGLMLRCDRADNVWEHHAIINDIANLIDRSRIVVVDLSGRNPNVFYEAGIAHTLGREVILITQHKDDVPFDLQHLRYIPYLNNAEGLAKLKAELHAKISSLLSRS